MDKREKECCKKVLEETEAFANENNLSFQEALLVRQVNQSAWVGSQLAQMNRDDITSTNPE